MKNSFLRLTFFGYIFIFFFFKINGIELLPDYVGYFLVALSLVGFAKKENKYATASLVFAVILFILSIFPLEFNNDYSIYNSNNLPALIIFILIIVLDSICRFGFYKTCSIAAKSNDNEKLAKNIDSVSFWFVILRPIIQLFVFWIITSRFAYSEFLLNVPLIIISLLEILYLFKITFIENLAKNDKNKGEIK